MPVIGRPNPPGNKQWVVDTSMILEPGKTVMPLPLGQAITIHPNGKPASPPPVPFVLIRTRLEKPAGEQPMPPAASAGVVDREISASSIVKALTVHLKVVAVNRDKLNKLGFQGSQLVPKSFESTEFLKSPQQNRLARVVAEPTLITLDGRPAEFTA